MGSTTCKCPGKKADVYCKTKYKAGAISIQYVSRVIFITQYASTKIVIIARRVSNTTAFQRS